MKKVCGIFVLMGISGCVTMQPKTEEYRLASVFDSEFAESQIATGGGEISGTAFLRQQGGGVVTCAGQDVQLIPITDYASDRIFRLYGGLPSINATAVQDVRSALRTNLKFIPDPPEYKKHSRTTKCDAQGEFQFTQVKDGEYYISTTVVWQVQTPQGGTLATRARVENGKSPRLIMTK